MSNIVAFLKLEVKFLKNKRDKILRGPLQNCIFQNQILAYSRVAKHYRVKLDKLVLGDSYNQCVFVDL